MDFFLSKTDTTVTQATLNYFAIYDPELSDQKEDDTGNNAEQLLLYLSNEPTEVDMNTKIRRIGLIRGINDFCLGFDENNNDIGEDNEESKETAELGDGLKFVELEDSRILLEKFEDRYSFLISISLTKIEDDDGKTVNYDKSVPLKFYSDLIIEGYNEFRLHNGTIQSLFETMERDEFVDYLERWWRVWFANYQLTFGENGFLKNFNDFYHRSSLRLDSELKYTIDNDIYNGLSKFKELLIWNHSYNDDEFGLIYEHFKTLDKSSKKRLLKWLELTSYYGINTDNLLATNIPKNPNSGKKSTNEDTTETQNTPGTSSETVYDPFKLVFNTITDVSNKTGITTGMNYGVKTMSDGLHAVNSYIPWRFGSRSTPETVEEPDLTTTPPPVDWNLTEPQFLIGKIKDNSVVYKNLYLKFEDEDQESLHRLVIFKYDTQLVLLIYRFNSNELNDVNYYDELMGKLNKLGKIHFPKQIPLSIPQHSITESRKRTKERKKKRFYFLGVDKTTGAIRSNIPFIPKDDIFDSSDDVIEEQKLNDLTLNKFQCQLIHKELSYLFADLQKTNWLKDQSEKHQKVDAQKDDLTSRQTSNISKSESSRYDTEVKERLNITKNGWWIYNINNPDKIVFILKNSRKVKRSHAGISNSSAVLLDISASVGDILGVDAKEWINDFMSGY